MKYAVLSLIRALGLLVLADQVKFLWHRLKVARRNRRFRAAHPTFVVPPADLAFDAYNHADWTKYRDGGVAHARIFAEIIDHETPQGPLVILEWGCGPARILRHLEAALPGRDVRLTGADYNRRSIAWCKAAFPDDEFVENDLAPPLPLANGRFDVVYCFSVLTHLGEATQLAWMAELHRVLKPGGLVICTTHGDRYRYLMARQDERDRFERGEAVTQARYAEGKKFFFALHPDDFVRRRLFGGFEAVRKLRAPDDSMQQDVWIARKPVAVRADAVA